MIVGIWSLKGGAGKTTFASSLAISFLLGSRRVLLVDGDSQRSLTAWQAKREEKGRPIPITQSVVGIREAMRREQCVVALVDCGPRLGGIHAILKEADCIVSPVVPNFFDLESLTEQIAALTLAGAMGRTLAVPNMAEPARKGVPHADTTAAIQSMAAKGFRVSSAVVQRRRCYRAGSGHGYGGPEQDVDSLEEMARLVREIDLIVAEKHQTRQS